MKRITNRKVFIISLIAYILFIYLSSLIQSCEKMEFERVVRIRTGEITDTTANSASITGFIQDVGENGITQYGHCWDIAKDPGTDLETKTNLGVRDDVGSFKSDLTDLLPGTTYFIRAYAISEGKTIYGDTISFKTDEALLPTVTTEVPSNFTDSSATCGGNVTSDGGATVTARGVCWNTSGSPTLSDYYTTDGSGTGSFISNITGLSPNTTYHVRAYATNNVETAYGNELSFKTKEYWQKSLGGSSTDLAHSIQQTTDGGYIIAGESHSDNGDVSGNNGDYDYWIVKLTSTGEIDWQKSLGGSSWDFALSIQQTTDGGYIIAGVTNSTDGDISGNQGYDDYWIVKLTPTGEPVWHKSLGGSSVDYAHSIQQTTDGGYIIAGCSYSDDGYVSGNHGMLDGWIVKITSTGNLDWQKSLGGSSIDGVRSIQQTTDGGYIVAGESLSDDGDVSGNHGDYDYWIVKLTSTGEIDWQKSLGGSGEDCAYSIQQTIDGGYIIAGASASDDGDISGNHGDYDYWIVKLTTAGEPDWQKSLGGSGIDHPYSIQQTADEGYIIAGESHSNNGNVSGNHGGDDYWIVKLTSTGEFDWQ